MLTNSSVDPDQILVRVQDDLMKQKSWLEQASIHSSYAVKEGIPFNNERLEFLGDSVLSLILSEYLFKTHSDIDEGQLSKWRSSLVNEESLQILGRKLRLDTKLKTAQPAVSDRMVASAFEAYIGAFFLTHGWLRVKTRTLSIFKTHLKDKLMRYSPEDYKTQLQEVVQATYHSAPTYELLEQKGPSHLRSFKSVVRVGKTILGEGVGKTKKVSEQVAAREALKKVKT